MHDPANGRHALAMVKEMERLARIAKSKPGNAKEGYGQLAERLGNAAPHFLPTFWEQAGRAFIAAENPKTAGTCFGEARQAERVHALPIDEARLGEVHVEFALAGALPVKALAQYARDLAERLPAERAYRQLRMVAVHRVAGGLAPHTGMAEDLARLAKAAGLRPEEEAEGVLDELLTLPALAKAPVGFWRSYRAALVRLGARSPAARGRLLGILPEPPGYVDFTEPWVRLLDETGASAALTGGAPPTAAPPGGAGAWLERFVALFTRSYRQTRSAALLDLIGRMLPRLREEGRELRPFGPTTYGADLDVLDVLIAGGIPVAPCESGSLGVGRWIQDTSPGRRDLAALAGYPGLARPWHDGVRSALTDWSDLIDRDTRTLKPEVVARFRAVTGLRTTLASWLGEISTQGQDSPVATLGDLIDLLQPLHSPDGAAIAPDVVRRFAASDIAGALARTLRTGLVAELHWPAYDDALGRLSDRAEVSHNTAWPQLIVNDATRAVVIGPDSVVLDHVMRATGVNPGWGIRPQCAYVDGQLLVQWHDPSGRHAYWTGRPSEVFEPTGYGVGHLALPLSGGGVTTGERPWRAGDRDQPPGSPVASDGVNFWRLEFNRPDHPPGPYWREYDPSSGNGGRVSRPRFFEEAGGSLIDGRCELRPAPGAAGSPLGEADGLVGWRVWTEPDGGLGGQGVDGRQVTVPAARNSNLLGALTLPGDDAVRAVLSSHQPGRPSAITICEPGTGRAASRYEPGRAGPPPLWWHWMRPRDERGSRALRAMSGETAGSLIEACRSVPEQDRAKAAEQAVRTVLPAITDGWLRAAVVTEVLRAVRYARWFARFGEYADTDTAAAPLPEGELVDDGDLEVGVRGIDEQRYYYRPPSHGTRQVLPAIAAVAEVLGGRAAEVGAPQVTMDWPFLLGLEGPIALRAVSPAFSAAERSALLGLLGTLARGGLVGHGGRLRVIWLASPPTDQIRPGTVLRPGRRILVVTHAEDRWDNGTRTQRFRAVECAPDGEFGPVDGLRVTSDRRPAGWADPARIVALADLVARHGPVPWRPERVSRLVELTGMTRAEATLLLAGLPNVASREANFLPAPTRALLGLSMAEARAARDALREVAVARRAGLLQALMPADPAVLWDSGPDVDRLAATWTGYFGRRRTLPEDVLLEANKMLPDHNGAEIARGLADPEACAWLSPGSLTAGHVWAVAVALPWLAYRLPTGDPARAALPEAHTRVLVALRHPDLLVAGGYLRSGGTVPRALVANRPGAEDTYYQISVADLTGPEDPALALFAGRGGADAVRTLLSVELAGLMAAVRAESAPPGRYPQDPRWSAPDLVEAVGHRYGTGADAAAYYLQLLALPDPTDHNVERWTGWSRGERKRLLAELVATGLVVAAKRERAGRSVFLPGGWLPLQAPNLPVERWKSGLYGLPDADAPGLLLVLPTTTVPAVFRAAWQRVVDGDEPRFQSLEEAR